MHETSQRLKQFKDLSEELCFLMEKEGWSVRPYNQESLPFFQQLDNEKQCEAIDLLQQYLDVSKKVYQHGKSLKDKSFCMDIALQYYDYQVSPSIYEQVVASDKIVEFYRADQTQFYRSLNFFEFTSYTIEDLYCRQWLHLYQRPEALTQKIYQAATSFKDGEMSPPVMVEDAHVLIERLSLERLQVKMSELFLAPLYQKTRFVGVAAVSRCAWAH